MRDVSYAVEFLFLFSGGLKEEEFYSIRDVSYAVEFLFWFSGGLKEELFSYLNEKIRRKFSKEPLKLVLDVFEPIIMIWFVQVLNECSSEDATEYLDSWYGIEGISYHLLFSK